MKTIAIFTWGMALAYALDAAIPTPDTQWRIAWITAAVAFFWTLASEFTHG